MSIHVVVYKTPEPPPPSYNPLYYVNVQSGSTALLVDTASPAYNGVALNVESGQELDFYAWTLPSVQNPITRIRINNDDMWYYDDKTIEITNIEFLVGDATSQTWLERFDDSYFEADSNFTWSGSSWVLTDDGGQLGVLGSWAQEEPFYTTEGSAPPDDDYGHIHKIRITYNVVDK